MIKRKHLCGLLLLFSILTATSINLSAVRANDAYGLGNYGACEYGSSCLISLTSNGTVSLNITPASGGSCTIQSDVASVTTDDADGYTLTLGDNGTNTSLINGGTSVPTTSGTDASPIALTAGKWGYRVDSLGGFGSGPTTAQSNVAIGSATFAGIKASNQTADTIASSLMAAEPSVNTTVWYGMCAGTNIASGSYSTEVTYTALAN